MFSEQGKDKPYTLRLLVLGGNELNGLDQGDKMVAEVKGLMQ